jgi:ankyrin repeat protein
MELLIQRANGDEQVKEVLSASDGKLNKSPLHYALENNRRGMVEYLIKRGAGDAFVVITKS